MRGWPGHQDADAWRLARSANRLLRARRERPRHRRAAEERYELAPSHVSRATGMAQPVQLGCRALRYHGGTG